MALDILQQIDAERELVQKTSLESTDDLEHFRLHYLGTKGLVKQYYDILKNATPEHKKQLGASIHILKKNIEEKITIAQSRFAPKSSTHYPEKDLTLENDNPFRGSRHPIQVTQKELIRIFQQIGFRIADGPEIEDDWHNFTALNIPPTHPARDMQDTFYIRSHSPSMLLRTHTSNVQIRELKKKQLPIRIICPGRVYRNETISARSHCFFHQVEGLYVDRQVSFADLKQTLYYFVKTFFGENVLTRFRPSYFPFTEPSAEMDISCLICQGKGCSVCKQSGWVEILGSGMVHPKLLENCGIDSNQYMGYAFGMGVERIAMLRYQIKDLRLFSENDVRFLSQFEGMY